MCWFYVLFDSTAADKQVLQSWASDNMHNQKSDLSAQDYDLPKHIREISSDNNIRQDRMDQPDVRIRNV